MRRSEGESEKQSEDSSKSRSSYIGGELVERREIGSKVGGTPSLDGFQTRPTEPPHVPSDWNYRLNIPVENLLDRTVTCVLLQRNEGPTQLSTKSIVIRISGNEMTLAARFLPHELRTKLTLVNVIIATASS